MRDAGCSAPIRAGRPVKPPSRPKDETARLGRGIYGREIRAQVEADHVGDVVAIDVSTGHWAIGDDLLSATNRLRAECQGAYDIWCERVGYRALASIGGGALQKTV